MIRLLILLLLFFLGYTLYDMLRRALTSGKKPPPPEKSPRGEEMMRDPHCGTFVPLSETVEATIDGKRHYFCSKRCRDAYKKR